MILVSGFKPFLNEKINPSQMLVESIENDRIAKVILPVEFDRAFTVLSEQIELLKPKIVIMLGQAGGRSKVSLEKIALNWRQTQSADESGYCPITGEIVSGANLALMTRFSVDELYEYLLLRKLPVEISFSAGAFVCNDLYYKTLMNYPEIESIFVHVPFIVEQNHMDKPMIQFNMLQEILNHVVAYSTERIIART